MEITSTQFLSLTNIRCVDFKMNNEIEAAKSFRSALELSKKLGDYDHEDTADIYHTLCENYITHLRHTFRPWNLEENSQETILRQQKA